MAGAPASVATHFYDAGRRLTQRALLPRSRREPRTRRSARRGDARGRRHRGRLRPPTLWREQFHFYTPKCVPFLTRFLAGDPAGLIPPVPSRAHSGTEQTGKPRVVVVVDDAFPRVSGRSKRCARHQCRRPLFLIEDSAGKNGSPRSRLGPNGDSGSRSTIRSPSRAVDAAVASSPPAPSPRDPFASCCQARVSFFFLFFYSCVGSHLHARPRAVYVQASESPPDTFAFTLAPSRARLEGDIPLDAVAAHASMSWRFLTPRDASPIFTPV